MHYTTLENIAKDYKRDFIQLDKEQPDACDYMIIGFFVLMTPIIFLLYAIGRIAYHIASGSQQDD